MYLARGLDERIPFILGRKPRRKSGLKSASRRASLTLVSFRGKLFVVQPLAWHARRLWVIRRTMAAQQQREGNKSKTKKRAQPVHPDRDRAVSQSRRRQWSSSGKVNLLTCISVEWYYFTMWALDLRNYNERVERRVKGPSSVCWVVCYL
ncbi:hypothetical protein BJV74DRAFT_605415 [Russula compacta]|nr:hypothetical protein BJV74DRAFT_605415 [Russula compacta]